MSGAIPSWAVKGAKVICVDASDTHDSGEQELTKGRVYILRRVEALEDGAVCWLEEIPSRPIYASFNSKAPIGYIDSPFGLARFRPVRTLETDISEHFVHLLNVSDKVEA